MLILLSHPRYSIPHSAIIEKGRPKLSFHLRTKLVNGIVLVLDVNAYHFMKILDSRNKYLHIDYTVDTVEVPSYNMNFLWCCDSAIFLFITDNESSDVLYSSY